MSKDTIITLDKTVVPEPMNMKVSLFETEKALYQALVADDLWKHISEDGVIAFTDCYPDQKHIGKFYLLDTTYDTLAHEATHMALHVMWLMGHRAGMPIVPPTERAPDIEEDLCAIVGHITELLVTTIASDAPALQGYKYKELDGK